MEWFSQKTSIAGIESPMGTSSGCPHRTLVRLRTNEITSLMLNRYSAFILLLALQSTAAGAQCWESHSLKSARAAHSEAAIQYSGCVGNQANVYCESQPGNETQYSTCVQNQARVGNQVRVYCKDEYSILQSAKRELEAATSQYESTREESCLQLDGRPPLFRSVPVPLR